MKATQVKVINPGEFEPPKEERECPICHRFTRHPYAKSQNGKEVVWLCRRECSEKWDTMQNTLPIMEIISGNAVKHLPDLD